MERLTAVLAALGDDKTKLVIDLSCRKREKTWFVAMNKWQTITDMEVNRSMSDGVCATKMAAHPVLRDDTHARSPLFRVPDPRRRQ